MYKGDFSLGEEPQNNVQRVNELVKRAFGEKYDARTQVIVPHGRFPYSVSELGWGLRFIPEDGLGYITSFGFLEEAEGVSYNPCIGKFNTQDGSSITFVLPRDRVLDPVRRFFGRKTFRQREEESIASFVEGFNTQFGISPEITYREPFK